MSKLPTAPRPITAAAIAKPRSSPLTRFGAAGGGAGRAPEGGALAVATGPLFAGAPATRAGVPLVGGAGGAGRPEGGGGAAWAIGPADGLPGAGGGAEPPAG